YGKILGEDKRLAAVDGAPAGDDAVARHLGLFHAEFGRAVLDEHVEFLERALVEQQLDALARGQFSAGVLRLDAFFAAAELGAGAPFFEGVQDILHAASARLLVPIWGLLTRPFRKRQHLIRPLVPPSGRPYMPLLIRGTE